MTKEMPRQPVVLQSLSATQLAATSGNTIEHYQDAAEQFWLGTRDHDVRQNIDALLRHLEGAGPHAILDFGCGPGRDLLAFKQLGHEPVGLDGSETFDFSLDDSLQPRQAIEVTAHKADGSAVRFTAVCRIDTPVEIEYYRNGGILHKVLRDLAAD